MPEFAPESLALWSGGRWTRPPAGGITRVSHDSRALVPGSLFVALAGPRFDGHDFLEEAAKGGVAAALCARGRAHASLPCLEVEDPLAALRRIAAGYGLSLAGEKIGVTGSAGKTTAKELLAAMLSRRGATCRTVGNWNNEIGLPLSLLRMEAADAFGVFELGMNHAGEIAPLAEILRPRRGWVTSIGEAHLENLGSLQAIAREKACLLEALPPDGTALVDLDSPWASLFRSVTRARIVTCSMEGEADYEGVVAGGRLHLRDRIRGEVLELLPPLPGAHMLRNVLQTAAMARECGLEGGEIEEGLAAFAAPPMRWERSERGGWTVINDAYNANPLSLRVALHTLAGLPAPAGRWAVLGGMSELGPGEEALHRSFGPLIASLPLAGLIVVGEKARWYLPERGGPPAAAVDSLPEAAELLRARAAPGAVILLKASRSEGLERLLPLLD